MTKIISVLIASSLVALSGYASEVEHVHSKQTNFYIATKAMVTLGSTVTEETSTLKGEKPSGEQQTMAGTYVTSSLDVSYTYKATHELGLFVKGGYEYEFEKIADLNVDAINSGFIYAAGTEYEINETMAFIGEYEVTTIKGPRGNSIFAGLVYSF